MLIHYSNPDLLGKKSLPFLCVMFLHRNSCPLLPSSLTRRATSRNTCVDLVLLERHWQWVVCLQCRKDPTTTSKPFTQWEKKKKTISQAIMINKKYEFPTYIKGIHHNTIYNEEKNLEQSTWGMAKCHWSLGGRLCSTKKWYSLFST